MISYNKSAHSTPVQMPPIETEGAMRHDTMLAYTGVPRVLCPRAKGQPLPAISLLDRCGWLPERLTVNPSGKASTAAGSVGDRSR